MSRLLYRQSFHDSTFSSRQALPLGGRRITGLSLLLFVWVVPLWGAQVRVPNGTMVRIKLHHDITTENVEKGDRVEFDVLDNVVVDNHVVIPKGAVAWAQVIKVKGAGKKKAKDASVTFRFTAVRAIDNQTVPLRVLPTKSRKADPEDYEIEENSPIPGLRERMIGATKGKEYAAYTDENALINAPDVPPSPATPPAAGATTPVAPSAPSGQLAPSSPAPEAAPALPGLVGAEPVSIDFGSDPSGADIVIDGNFVGNTPSTLRVAPGRHVMELRLAGYRSWTRTMVVEPGSHPSIRAALEKQ